MIFVINGVSIFKSIKNSSKITQMNIKIFNA